MQRLLINQHREHYASMLLFFMVLKMLLDGLEDAAKHADAHI